MPFLCDLRSKVLPQNLALKLLQGTAARSDGGAKLLVDWMFDMSMPDGLM